MKKKDLWYDALFSLAAGLALAALLAFSQPGKWFLGFLAFLALVAPGAFLLVRLWRAAQGGRALAGFIALAFLLRVGVGVLLEQTLPVAGTGSETQQAGYVFYDAYHRDAQAWELAASGQPLWMAFSKTYSMDQYGGLLGLSAGAYRLLSPDAHRPLLVIVLGALAAAAGVALAWKAARLGWGERFAAPVALLLALYPESLLQGSAQMREPFLITFIVMAFLGGVLLKSACLQAAAWLAGGFAGMLLFSPGVAVFTLVVLAGWLWLRSERRHLPWKWVLVVTGALLLALILLSMALARGSLAGKPLPEVLAGWLSLSSKWDIYLLEQSSGWVQLIFERIPAWLRLPFIACYGLAQPVLPAAIADPAAVPWKVIGILRALGWYALAPFALFAGVSALRLKGGERAAWLWLWAASWGWALLSAIRAGADQWDNPRYRVMILFIQALLAVFAWVQARQRRDPWLGRLLIMEGIFLLFFSQWYASRYLGTFGKLPFGVMVALILALWLVVVGVGWWSDRRRARRRGSA